jgi:hypothetical protein
MKTLPVTRLIIGLLALAASGNCSLIEGVMNATGTAEISLGSIAFLDNQMFINPSPASQTGGFTTLAGTGATIDNITNPPDETGVLVTPVNDFITFAAAPNISITFTALPAGIDGAAGCTASPPAANQECTPNIPEQSPFNLQNTSATSSTASFSIVGYELDSLTGDTVPIIGTFTEPFASMPYQTLLGEVLAGGTVTTAFSAQFFTEDAPEPATESLMIGASLLAAVFALRTRSRRQA